MNKKEIKEIKKLYGIKDCAIQRMSVGYIDAEKNLKCMWSESFLNLPEEEIFKYLEILKKGLSGKVGKNLCTYEYSTAEETPESKHESLMKLRSTKLKDDEVLKAFYKNVAENYPEVENVAVLLIYNVYDIPCKGDDEQNNVDASDEVYEYISCYLCPVKLEDPGLVYTGEKFEHKDRRWQIDKPVHGFIFPSFEDRCEDIHSITVYNKKSDGKYDDLDFSLLGVHPMLSADAQKESFTTALENAVSECDTPINIVSSIHESIALEMEGCKDSDNVLSYDKLHNIAVDAGLSEDVAESFVDELRENMNSQPINTVNILDSKTTKIKSSDVEIKIDAERCSSVEKREIDGRVYLLVPVLDTTDIEVNGVKLG